ncbi:MAG: RNA-binding protein [Planctomycetes bacterium]|nr:RNA-binding protein [Planctomycetota bacterium]
MNIYAGNLAQKTTEDELRQVFEEFGQVTSVTIIKDKFSGESRGFGFVEMPSRTEAQAALNSLNGRDLNGRVLNVNEALPRSDDRKRSGGGRSSGGRSGGGSGRSGGGGKRGGGRPW